VAGSRPENAAPNDEPERKRIFWGSSRREVRADAAAGHHHGKHGRAYEPRPSWSASDHYSTTIV
jgi:hypothetical protein